MTDPQPPTVAGPANDETEVVPPVTQAAPELAWSCDEPDTELLSRPWRSVWPIAGVVLVCAAAIALSIGAIGWLVQRRDDAAPPTASATLAPSMIPAAALPPVTLAPSPTTTTQPNPRPLEYDKRGVPIIPRNPTAAELQQAVVAIFDRDGIPYDSPSAASADADSLCQYLTGGHHSFADLMGWIRRARPSLVGAQVGGFAGASIGVYCRQYGYLIFSTDGATS